jgi:hypothetical protein
MRVREKESRYGGRGGRDRSGSPFRGSGHGGSRSRSQSNLPDYGKRNGSSNGGGGRRLSRSRTQLKTKIKLNSFALDFRKLIYV